MMKQKTMMGAIALITILSILSCASGSKNFDLGSSLGKQGKYQEAIQSLEQAIQAEPSNKKYQAALAKLKDTLVMDYVAQVEVMFSTDKPLTISTINTAKNKIEKARTVVPGHPALSEIETDVEKKERYLIAKIKDLLSLARQNMAAKKWNEAYLNLENIQKIYPDYKDTAALIRKASENVLMIYYQQGKNHFDREEYREAILHFQKAMTIKPGHSASSQMLQKSRERDNKDYFAEQAQTSVREENWEPAIRYFVRALEYDPNDSELKQAYQEARARAALFYVNQAKSQMYGGWIMKAFNSYDQAIRLTQTPDSPEFTEFLRELAGRTQNMADRFKSSERNGAAWFWYNKIQGIDPENEDILYKIQMVEDKIIERIKKSIAVFDFGSPSNAPDSGSIFANSLSTFLFKTASEDIKIMERKNIKSILEEMKLGQIGIVSPKTAKQVGRIYGIDVAVMGSVLRYNVDSSSHTNTKTVTYKVKKTEKNIDYLNWKAKNPNPTREELARAPTPFVDRLKDREKDYKISTHKKVAFVTVSFRIVDVDTGENLLIDTIIRTKIATDETSAGVEKAGIRYDPLEIPTDNQLLQELTNEVVEELGTKGLLPLIKLEKIYLELGKKHLKRRNNEEAVENFVNVIFDEKIKKIKDAPHSRESETYLETIFLDYQDKEI